MKLYWTVTISALTYLPWLQARHIKDQKSSCRCLPGDTCWPTLQEWKQLNTTLHGKLITTVPLGAPCHDPTYNSSECFVLRSDWASPALHFSSASSVMLPLFQDRGCDPFAPEATPCRIGNEAYASINVTTAADVAAGLKFAREKNIRVVIKNTGHDFLGKSTGKGSLGIWTHNLKDIEFLEYKSTTYSGPAIKMGAGVQAWEAYEAAHARGFRVVGGECSTVGLAGGYTQGGGHSSLSSTYGLGADQTLEWEVVTANGTHLVASPTQNSELYWALSGGGGGTYAVVLSLTSKVHKDGIVGGANLTFSSEGIHHDTYWDLIGLWQQKLPAIVDTGAQTIYTITNKTFSILAVTSPGSSTADVATLLRPFTSELRYRNVSYTMGTSSLPTFLDHFATYLGPLPFGPFMTAELVGGRLVPRSVIETKEGNAAVVAALRRIASDPDILIDNVALSVADSHVGVTQPNAVLPAWRRALIHIVVCATWNYTAPWETNFAKEDEMTNINVPLLENITPDSGTYLNEADYRLKTWKQDFYGENYAQLRAVKARYDSEDLFYATTAVGSDEWTVANDGRLCRA